MSFEREVSELYRRLIEGWNANDAEAMAAAIAADGLVIGYDGSQMFGREEVASQVGQIFADHKTATYVAKVRSVKRLGSDAALLHAVVGMVSPGGTELMPERNAIQTVVASRENGGWYASLFQTTPAQFHGRPELTEQLTGELSELVTNPS
jgi:uncharacterized protein (TIGR02246 family)